MGVYESGTGCNLPSWPSRPETSGLLLALALFGHVVAGLGGEEPTARSWFEVEPFLLAHVVRLTGQSKMGAAGRPLQ